MKLEKFGRLITDPNDPVVQNFKKKLMELRKQNEDKNLQETRQ